VSEGCRALTGYDPEALVRGDRSYGDDVIVDEDREELRADIQRMLEADGSFLVTYRIRTADGDVRWVRERGRSLYEDGGTEIIEGVNIDVTERKRAEQKLAEERDMFADGPAVVFRWVPDEAAGWPVEYVSENVEDVLGYSPAAFESGELPYADILLEGEMDRITGEAEANSDGTTERFSHDPYRVRTKDGDVRWVKDTTKIVRDDDGEIVNYLGYLVDITKREERERELRRNTEQLESLFEVLPVGVVVAEATGELVEANTTAHEIWGGDVFDAESVPEYERYPVYHTDTGAPVDPEEMTLARVLDGEKVHEPDVYEIETEDGERRIIEAKGMPIRDEAGEVTRGVVTLSDVTERHEARRNLRKSEQRYRTLAEHFPNGAVGVFDTGFRYTLVDGAIWDEIDPDAADLEGEVVSEALPSPAGEDLEQLFRQALEAREIQTTRTEFAGRVFRVWATPLFDDDGEVRAGLSFSLDVTDRVEREQRLEELVDELEESNERLEQFAYAASHDLQEPLRMVSSYLQLIEQRYEDALDEDGREFLEFAVDGADRMRQMIDGLLEYSRVQTREQQFESVDLNAVLGDVREDLEVKIEESGAEIDAESLPGVEGDASQLRQVFQNLLDNAIKYSGDVPPSVRVSAEPDGDQWVISVRDEGVGIDPDDTDRVFDLFQSFRNGEGHTGSGIGLALCERIVERHGGDIRVESEPGSGTTFSFTLPAVRSADE
jgi:PAS domain S-box-containing protein